MQSLAPRTGDVDRDIDIERAMATLPERQRLSINCFYFAGLSVSETASVMNCSDGTVKSTLSDARRNLRARLES
jgi:RNA polymerase sigma-70 factor (ECF subfamily)